MKIYAVADIHGNIRKLNLIKENIRNHCPDILVLAGDLTRFFSHHELISFLKNIHLPVAAILGNSDSGGLKNKMAALQEIRILDDGPYPFNGFRFIGASGTLPVPFASRICWKEKQTLGRMEHLLTPGSIMVLHPPPRGIRDKVGDRFHAGSRNIKNFIDKHQPFLLICGHIHEQAGISYSNQTAVVNCAMNRNSAGALIDISADRSVRAMLLTVPAP